MRNPEFIEHIIGLYHKQKGLCSITGVELGWQKGCELPFLMCIHRLDTSKKFEIGNVMLVCNWIGFWFRDDMKKCLAFINAVIEQRKKKKIQT
jgi:hypothetical protein